MRLLKPMDIEEKTILSKVFYETLNVLSNPPESRSFQEIGDLIAVPKSYVCMMRRAWENESYARHVTKPMIRRALELVIEQFPALRIVQHSNGRIIVRYRVSSSVKILCKR